MQSDILHDDMESKVTNRDTLEYNSSIINNEIVKLSMNLQLN